MEKFKEIKRNMNKATLVVAFYMDVEVKSFVIYETKDFVQCTFQTEDGDILSGEYRELSGIKNTWKATKEEEDFLLTGKNPEV